MRPKFDPIIPLVSWYEQNWVYIIWGCFHTNLSFARLTAFAFFSKFSYVKFIPHCGPKLPLGPMMYTSLNLYMYFLRILPQNASSSFSGPTVIGKKNFKDYLCIIRCKSYSTLLYSNWGYFHTNLNFSSLIVFEKILKISLCTAM